MRVVTTWMYFDREQISAGFESHRRRGRGEEPEPGIGIAWFAGDTSTLGSISNHKLDLPPKKWTGLSCF
jgi:hypothetical protein